MDAISFSMLPARFRVALGFCPLCNSDAPELDNCPICDGYSSARGDKFPPSKELKIKWLREMKDTKKAKLMAKNLVRDSRKKGF